MAFSAHKSAATMQEKFDDATTVEEHAVQLADWLREAKRVCVFTGAGISTSAGIADYRGPNGVWTLQAQGKESAIRSADMTKAVPTVCHMALVKMLEHGLLHHVISQNVDGLHRKSGVPAGSISELHGNTHIERCAGCQREYVRDVDVTRNVVVDANTWQGAGKSHATGRRCDVPECGGVLEDTVVHFGEQLPLGVVTQGFEQAQDADLHIVLGSSLSVAPASKMPEATKLGGGRLVIVNLQKTPLDKLADMKVHAKIDEFLTRVMACLGLEIPGFTVKRRLAVWREECAGAAVGPLRVGSVDPTDNDEPTAVVKAFNHRAGGDGGVAITVDFEGHYGEPSYEMRLARGDVDALADGIALWDIEFDPSCALAGDAAAGGWTTQGIRVVPRRSDARPDGAPPPTAAAMTRRTQNKRVETTVDVTPAPKNFNLGGCFNITPLEDCPHCAGIPPVADADPNAFDPTAPCATCGNVGENMVCLTCRVVCCGRHVQGHMLTHNAETKHPIVMGFGDLSFWCYDCDAYIEGGNPKLSACYTAYHVAKFGEGPAGVAVQEADRALIAQVCKKYAAPMPEVAAVVPSPSKPAAPAHDDYEDAPELFSVYPIAGCEHTMSLKPPSAPIHADPKAPCGTCGHVGECMMCLSCCEVHCGRHVQQHMLAHHDATGHPVVIGFRDLSIWCYHCDEYILPTNVDVAPFHMALYMAKFGELPPGAVGRAKIVEGGVAASSSSSSSH